MKTIRNHPFFRALQYYVTFFLLVSFIVSCCMALFVSILADTMGLVFTKENIADAAKLTFRQVLKAVNSYVVFLLTVGFAVTCCMMLFLNVFSASVGLELNANNIAVMSLSASCHFFFMRC